MQDVLIRWADAEPTRWRNGGGVTRELLAHPGSGGDFDWRVSVATVDRAGPFSSFPDVDRVITLLAGEEMVLHRGSEQVTLNPLQPFAFRGEDAVECSLPSGPTSDFNVMTRRDRCTARVSLLHAGTGHDLEPVHGERLLLCVDEAARVTTERGEGWDLSRYDLLRVAGPITVHGTFVEVVLAPVTK